MTPYTGQVHFIRPAHRKEAKMYQYNKTRQVYAWEKLPLALDVHTVALIFNCTDDCVKKWLQSGKLQGVKIGRAWIIDRDYLRQVISGKGAA